MAAAGDQSSGSDAGRRRHAAVEAGVIHVERHDGDMFCEVQPEYVAAFVDQREWHAEPDAIQRATCPQCLLHVFMLGDSAVIALRNMGMQVEVRTVEPIGN